MEQLHEIEEWLQGSKDYNVGLMLYSKFGKYKTVTATLVNQGNTAGNRALMEKSLREALKQQQGIKPSAVEIPASASTPNLTFTPVKDSKPDNTVANLQLKANKVYQEMGVVHARMGAASTNEERAALWYQLIRVLQEKWIDLVQQRDYYLKHGKLPEPKAKKVTKVKQLADTEVKRLLELRPKITRAQNDQIPKYQATLKANPNDKKTAEKLKKREAELAEWKAEVERLEKGGDNG